MRSIIDLLEMLIGIAVAVSAGTIFGLVVTNAIQMYLDKL